MTHVVDLLIIHIAFIVRIIIISTPIKIVIIIIIIIIIIIVIVIYNHFQFGHVLKPGKVVLSILVSWLTRVSWVSWLTGLLGLDELRGFY